jgi:stage II sporulation protein D
LVSVPDPWSTDPSINPSFASWTRSVTQAQTAKAFLLPDVVSVSFPLRTRGGGVKSAVATSSTGQTAILTGEVFRSRLALPSTYLGRSLARLSAANAVQLAVAVNKSERNAGSSAILSDDGGLDFMTASAAAVLAAHRNLPHLLLANRSLSKATLDELKRRKVRSVTLVGTTEIIPLSVERALAKAGIKAQRITSNSLTATVAKVATLIPGDPILLSSGDPEVVASVVGQAVRLKRPLLFVTGNGLTTTTLDTLRSMSGRTLTLLARSGSIDDSTTLRLAAVITVEDLRRAESDEVVTTALRIWDAATPRILIIGNIKDGIATASLGQGALIARSAEPLPVATLEWLLDHPLLAQITVVGSPKILGVEIFEALRALR